MLTSKLLHPEILRALAASGHFSQILIADGNYAVASRAPASATVVHLNLMRDLPRATDVLAALVDAVPLQAAAVMRTPDGREAPVQAEFRNMLPAGVEFAALERQAFYDAASSPLVSLVIASADTRRFANLLLTVGVLRPADDPA